MVSDSDFSYISQFVREHAAIVIDPSKAYLVSSRLEPLAKEVGFNGIGQMVASLKSKGCPDLQKKVIDAMTTNETSFFRDIEPFEYLKKVAIPEIISRKAKDRTLRIWSAACSSGQEAYSIAFMIKESFPELSQWKITIHATDISSAILEKARRGEYSQYEINRGLPVQYLVKYFQKEGMQWRVVPAVREMVNFSYLNLVSPWRGLPIFDIVFLRNVLIYFDVPTKRSIFEQLRGTITKDTYVFLGAAETTLNVHDSYERVIIPDIPRCGCYKLRVS